MRALCNGGLRLGRGLNLRAAGCQQSSHAGKLQRCIWTLKQSPFEVLGIAKEASTTEIKKAYFNLAKLCHPDLSEDESSHAKFQDVSAAYALLMDEDARRCYEAGQAFQGGYTPADPKEAFYRVFQDMRMKSPFAAMEARAMHAVVEMARGNQTPVRDFVIDYRVP